MSFFDDISMGLGLKDKDDAYRQRTAETIRRNQGSEAADRYRESQGIGAADGALLGRDRQCGSTSNNKATSKTRHCNSHVIPVQTIHIMTP